MQRQPIADQLTGVVTGVDGKALLSSAELADGAAIARGELTIRYGITYLGKPHISIVPDLVVADYGELLIGEAAWTFLMESAHLYPRADVCGLRNDGVEDMVAVKQLDIDYPYDVFVYGQPEDERPFAALSALIDADSASYPERILRRLPRYDSVSSWRQNA
ncbi:MAG: hypothetical protein F4X87_07390 [Chloroflexi bacterium]|nr:hypothetical protein [Chloroflexota bacterium]